MTITIDSNTPLLGPLRLAKLVRSLLSRPEAWTKGTFARTKDGEYVQPTDPNASCFCLIGAVTKVVADCPDLKDHANMFIWDLSKQVCGRGAEVSSIFVMQDSAGFTHADMLALLDKLISYYNPGGTYDPARDALVDTKQGG